MFLFLPAVSNVLIRKWRASHLTGRKFGLSIMNFPFKEKRVGWRPETYCREMFESSWRHLRPDTHSSLSTTPNTTIPMSLSNCVREGKCLMSTDFKGLTALVRFLTDQLLFWQGQDSQSSEGLTVRWLNRFPVSQKLKLTKQFTRNCHIQENLHTFE